MKCSLDKVLFDARQLANKIRASDQVADELIKQASDAHDKILDKKKTQEGKLEYDKLAELAKKRPRSDLMMKMVAENKKLEILQQENKVLRTSLNEYETTFHMIIKKYKKHKEVLEKFEMLKNGDLSASALNDASTVDQIVIHYSKIAKLKKEVELMETSDNKAYNQLSEIHTKLLVENRELTRLIKISEEVKNDLCNSINHTSSNVKSKLDLCKNATLLNNSHENPSKKASSLVNGLATKAKCTIYSNKSVNSNPEDNGVDDETVDDDDHSSIASDASIQTITG